MFQHSAYTVSRRRERSEHSISKTTMITMYVGRDRMYKTEVVIRQSTDTK